MSDGAWRRWWRATCRRARVRPSIEPLEERAVPAVYRVTNFTDDPRGPIPAPGPGPFRVATLRTAVLAANANPGADTIVLAAGTYTLSLTGSNEDDGLTGDLDVTDDLTILGRGAGLTRIDAQPLTDAEDPDRVLHVHPPDSQRQVGPSPAPTVTLSGLTIQNGRVEDFDARGGGILNEGGSTLTVKNSVVSNNTAEATEDGSPFALGGGIDNDPDSTLTLLNSRVTDNRAIKDAASSAGVALGGGIYNCDDATAHIIGSVVSGNVAENDGRGQEGDSAEGGGVYNEGSLTVDTTTFSENRATGAVGGEGLFAAEARGGGVEHVGHSLVVTRSTFVKNEARGGDALTGGDGLGGGLFAAGGGGTSLIVNSTFSENSARGGDGLGGGSGRGGGLYLGSGDGCEPGPDQTQLVNVTVTLNHAFLGQGLEDGAAEGGGVFSEGDGPPLVLNTIIATNSADAQRDVISNDDVRGPFTSEGNNLIGIGTGSTGFTNGVKHDQVGVTTPLDPGLLPLADNGGPTQTHALKATSTARNRGNTALAPSIDQRGVPRPQEHVADIGAFEFAPPNARADVGVTKTVRQVTLPAALGGQFRCVVYTITVRNHGPGTATQVKVLDTLPRRLVVEAVRARRGAVSRVGRALIVDIGTLNFGEAVTIKVVGLLPRRAPAQNTARVPLRPYDPNPANNSATVFRLAAIPLFFSDPVSPRFLHG